VIDRQVCAVNSSLRSRNYMCLLAADVGQARITRDSSSHAINNAASATGSAPSVSGDVPSNDITLSPEQKHVLDLVQAGKKCVFFHRPLHAIYVV
jgi:hypothetical protein